MTAITGAATGFGLFFRLIYILALTAALAFAWAWFATRGLEVSAERRTKRARVGDDIEERVTVRNRSALPKSALEVEDATDMPGYRNGRAVSLPSRSFRSWRSLAPARKRGVYKLGPVRVSGSDPFGLFRSDRDFGEQDDLVVYPQVHELPLFDIPAGFLTGESSARRRSHDLTPHAASVREYAFGDSLNRIHWNSSARTGRLMSKEFDLGLASDVWIVVDLHKDVQAGELEESTDEYAVSIAASLAQKYLRAQLPVGLVAYGDARYALPADVGAAQHERIMETLARGMAEGATPLEDVIAQEERAWGTHSSVVVITPSHRAAWTTAVRELGRRRVNVTAILVDGESFGGMFRPMDNLAPLLEAGVAPYAVRMGDSIPLALSSPLTAPRGDAERAAAEKIGETAR